MQRSRLADGNAVGPIGRDATPATTLAAPTSCCTKPRGPAKNVKTRTEEVHRSSRGCGCGAHMGARRPARGRAPRSPTAHTALSGGPRCRWAGRKLGAHVCAARTEAEGQVKRRQRRKEQMKRYPREGGETKGGQGSAEAKRQQEKLKTKSNATTPPHKKNVLAQGCARPHPNVAPTGYPVSMANDGLCPMSRDSSSAQIPAAHTYEGRHPSRGGRNRD